jgi:hypothetical protein
MTADAVAIALILGMAIPATIYWFVFVCLTPGWWRTSVGRAMGSMATSMMLLVNISAAYQVFGDDYPLRDVVRLTVFGFIFVALWLKAGAIVHARFKAWRHGRLG